LDPTSSDSSPWLPLQNRLFRSIWIASLVSEMGGWMQDVGSGWLITSLSSSPSMVALVEAANTLPVMLLALPAGALADIVDRRQLLIAVQVYALLTAGALAVLTWFHMTTGWVLLAFTFALGVSEALTLPAWTATVPELVARAQMPAAVALNSVAINGSRAVGPAIAGILVSISGPWLVFALNALSYVGVVYVLLRWRRDHRKSSLPAERFLSAMRVGMRFVLHTRALQGVLIRGAAFFGFAASTWSLFPLVVRRELDRGPEVYGLLLACIGLGAVVGALLLPTVRLRVSRDSLVGGATAVYALAALALAWLHNIALLSVAMILTGIAWISILSALQVAAQLTLPEWVRARGLAAFVVIFMAGMALGSILWGQVATHTGIPAALTCAALGMVFVSVLTWRIKLGSHEVADLQPSLDWPEPILAERPEPDSGPVLVTTEYRVRPDKRAAFLKAMQAVGEMRRRNGAFFWELFHDSADTTRFIECFMDESWIEHLRQHERASVADRQIRESAYRLLIGGKPTEASHWLPDSFPS
jgi:MFS family permease